ncbi:MAG: hypothetical protein EA409_13930, partial [Saprospirales bacterium]
MIFSSAFWNLRKSCYFYFLTKLVFLLISAQSQAQNLEVFISWTGNSQNYPFHAVDLNNNFEYCEVGELLGNFPPNGPYGSIYTTTFCPDGNIYWRPGTIPGLIQFNPVTKEINLYYDEFPLPGGEPGSGYLACTCDTILYSIGGQNSQNPLNKTPLGADSSVFMGFATSFSNVNLGEFTNLSGELYLSSWQVNPYGGFIYKIDPNDIANPQPVIDYQDIFTGTPRLFNGLTASPYCNTLIGFATTIPPHHFYGRKSEVYLINLETGQMIFQCSLEFENQHRPLTITSQYEALCGPCELLLDLDGDGSSGAGGHDYLSPDTVSCLSNEGARIADEDVFIAKDAPISFMTIEILSPHTGEYLDLIGSVAGLTVSGQ